MMIVIYLVSIVAANLLVTWFGPAASIIDAFLLIALDLTARDKLHDQWEHKHLWRNMTLLILSGSVLSAILNINALPIAIASFVAFMASGSVDTLVYAALGKHAKMLQVNGSNVASAAVDSLIFPAIAFGFLWAWVLYNPISRNLTPKEAQP
jgi:queuosine precursor transporter